MKKLIFIFLFINNFIYGQNINILMKNPDKVMISNIFFQDKATLPPPTTNILFGQENIPQDIEIIEQKLDEKELSEREVKKLIKFLENNNNKPVPLPYHYDIQLDFYKNGKIVQIITISSETKKLVIRDIDCSNSFNTEYKKEDDCIYMSVISKKMEKFICKLLNR